MTTCPTDDRLKSLLDGQLSDAEQAELQQHIDSCERCQQTLEGLVAGKESWDGIARRLGDGETPVTPALHDAIAAAKEMEATIPSVKLPAGFLQPSEQPDSMGRLDHYEVLQEVGSGGMGIVLKAFDTSLRRVIAIKVMSPHLAANAAARRRFVREAQAAAAVAHEHVVAIHAVADQHEPPYLAMQFIEGKTLQQRLDKVGALSVREVLRIGMQTASGLAAAHAQGLVHRDIKPANILLENGVERVKLTDFGLARAVDDASVTQSGVIAGTPLFMSPEQARGDVVDHRSDLFSLGSVMYAMCVGHAPFRASTTMGVLKRVCDESPRPIREVNPDVPDWLSDIIAKLLAKAPADRFQTASEVADLLGQCLAHVQQPSVVARPAGVVAPIEKASAKSTHTASSSTMRVPFLSSPMSALPIHPMFGAIFWFGLTMLVISLGLAALDQLNVFLASAAAPLSGPFMLLVGIGSVALVLMVIVPAISKRDWRATSLGPRPILPAIALGVLIVIEVMMFAAWGENESAARRRDPAMEFARAIPLCTLLVIAAGLLLTGVVVGIRRFIRGFDTKTHGGRRWGTTLAGALLSILAIGFFSVACFVAAYWLSYAGPPPIATTAHLTFKLAGPHVEVMLNGEKVAVPASGQVDLQLVAGEYVIATIQNGRPEVRYSGTLAAGQSKTLIELQTGGIQITGPLVMAYGPGAKAPNVEDYFEIQGRWTIVSQEKDGELVTTPQRGIWIEFDRGYMRFDVSERTLSFLAQSLVALYAAEKPSHIDILDIGAKGIYRLDRDTLTLAIADKGRPRPTEFVSRPGSSVTLTVCRRVEGEPLASSELNLRSEQRGSEPTNGEQTNPVTKLLLDEAGVWNLTRSPDGKLFGAIGPNGDAGGSKVKVWDTATLTERLTFTSERTIYDLAFLPDGQHIATCESDHCILLRDLTTGGILHEFAKFTDSTLSLAVDENGETLIFGGPDMLVRAWDLKANQVRTVFSGATTPIHSVAASPDGKFVAAGCENGHILVWDAKTADRRHLWTHFDRKVTSVAFSPNSRHLAAGSWSHIACIFDLGNDYPWKVMKRHTDHVRSITWSPDGKQLATASSDGTAMIWETEKAERLAVFNAKVDQCFDAVFLDNGRLATAHRDGVVRVWQIAPLSKPLEKR